MIGSSFIKKSNWLPWIAAIAFFMQTLDATILNTALPTIAASFNHSPITMQSVIISYALTVALLIPINGWLADRFGTRNVFVVAIFFFALGSLFCALSFNLTSLVISRILQGIGGALMPVSRLVLLKFFPKERLLSVLNLVTIPGLLGPIIGPSLGGIFVTYATWHWIFLINIPIAIIGIICTIQYMPNYKSTKTPFDTTGFLLFAFGLFLISSGIELLGENITPWYFTLLITPLGMFLLLRYTKHAKKHKNPLIYTDIFKVKAYSIGIISTIFSRLGIGSIPFLMPLFFQIGFEYTPLKSGLLLAPIAIGAITAKPFTRQIITFFGFRLSLIIVTTVISLMMLLFTLFTPTLQIWLTIMTLATYGFFISLQFSALSTLTLGKLKSNRASMGNMVLSVSQQLSISLSTTVSALILQYYTHHFSRTIISHFHYTFFTLSFLTLLAASFFLFLKHNEGNELLVNKKELSDKYSL